MKRPLADALQDLLASVQPSGIAPEFLHLVTVYFDVPLEVSLRRHDKAIDFLGDLPNWRWRTAFDPQPGRLRVSFETGGTT